MFKVHLVRYADDFLITGINQAVLAKREDVLDQDSGNDRRLGQPDGRRNDPAFESADQRLDHVSPLCVEQTHLYVRGSSDLPNAVALVPATAPEQGPEVDQGEILPARRTPPLGLHRYAV